MEAFLASEKLAETLDSDNSIDTLCNRALRSTHQHYMALATYSKRAVKPTSNSCWISRKDTFC